MPPEPTSQATPAAFAAAAGNRDRLEAEAYEDLHRSRAELSALIDEYQPEPAQPPLHERADYGEFPRSRILRQVLQHKLPAGALAAGVVLFAVNPRLASSLLRKIPVAALVTRMVGGKAPTTSGRNLGGPWAGLW